MLSLPIIFLCNIVIFALVLEERFKVITTLAVSSAAYLMSILSWVIVDNLTTSVGMSDFIAVIVSVFWALIASVFVSSNNIAQKLFTALILVANYSIISDFVPIMLSNMPFSVSGIMAVLLGNGLFILFSLIVMSFITRPLHYFYRRRISPSVIIMCFILSISIWISAGGLDEHFELDPFAFRFLLSLVLFVTALFALRSAYGGAKYKSKDTFLESDNVIKNMHIENFADMVANVNSFKNAKKGLEYAFDRIDILAETGKTEEISNYIRLAKANNRISPLLAKYSDEEYINAIVATKAATAESKGIRLETNLATTDSRFELLDICVITLELLNLGINNCCEVDGEKFIRLNAVQSQNSMSFEVVYSHVDEKESFVKKTAYDFIKFLFEEKEIEEDELRGSRAIVDKNNGSLSMSYTDDTVITRIGINY